MPFARTVVVSLIVLSIECAALAADPSAAIGTARQHIADKQFDAAVKVLQDAMPDAAALHEPNRTKAMAALHFYTAIAFSGKNAEGDAREALERFFLLSPDNYKIDPAKFDAKFVRVFNAVAEAIAKERQAAFDAAYPAYKNFRDPSPPDLPVERWGEGPALALLATAEEKAEWHRLTVRAEQEKFIESFWERRREHRTEFLRRAAFADETFFTEKTRGSLTDRGRVFVLLGPPKIVRFGNLTQADGARVVGKRGPVTASGTDPNRGGWAAMDLSDRAQGTASLDPSVKGRVERWVYSRDQLPKGFPDDQVAFKFLTEEGYGENVLQRDFLVLKALKDAAQVH